MKKKMMYSEAAYLLGMAVLALGTALMEWADFGVSMVVAPAYLVYAKLSAMEGWGFFTFGMAEYLLQFVLLAALTVVMRRFKMAYLFSFVTAVIYGLMLDAAMALVSLLPFEGMAARVAFFLVGMVSCSAGISLLFHTYISPEAYEMVVKEISEKYGLSLSKTKTVYDCISCAVAVVMSFAFFGFGEFKGVKWGTVICALLNGWTIGQFGRFFEARLDFRDGLKLRKYFA